MRSDLYWTFRIKIKKFMPFLRKSLFLINHILVLFRRLFCEFNLFLIESVVVFGSDDIWFEELKEELEECKNHEVSRSFNICSFYANR